MVADNSITSITNGNLTEEWRDIPGYEGVYQASTLGRIKRMVGYRCRTERILKCSARSRNLIYPSLELCRGNGKVRLFVHQLITLTFIGECPEGQEVNHINGNREDNRLSNLEYCTHRQNIQHAHETGLTHPQHGSQRYNAKLNDEDIVFIRKAWRSGIRQDDLAVKFGVSSSLISKICNGKRWGHIALEGENL